jgi:hypothetical protein
MKAETLKKEIYKAIEVTKDNDILNAVYTILKKTAHAPEIQGLTVEQKKDLKNRLAAHKAGNLKYYTLQDVKKLVKSSLSK